MCAERHRCSQPVHAVRQAVYSRQLDLDWEGLPTERAALIPRNSQAVQVGWSSMSTGDVGDRSALVDQIPWCFVLQTPTDHESMTASLYSTRSGTLSLWSWSWISVDRPRLYLRASLMRRAAAFRTRCKVPITYRPTGVFHWTLRCSSPPATRWKHARASYWSRHPWTVARYWADEASKNAALTVVTCLSRLRSDEKKTPRTRTWSLGMHDYFITKP